MENSLPNGWIAISLKSLGLNFFKGVNVKEKGSKGEYYFIPSGANFSSGYKHERIKRITKAEFELIDKSKILKGGDILFNSGGVGTLGRSSYFHELDKPAVSDSFVLIIRDSYKVLNSKFIYYWFQSNQADSLIKENTRGTTGITSIKAKDIEQFVIPFPPLAEQQRIVAKLDELMEKIDRSRARLESIPKILKRFRQSILSAAVSGKLTEEWRGNDLYESVELSEISIDKPELWHVVDFNDVIDELRNGLGKRPSNSPPGIPILRISSVRSGLVDFSEFKYYPETKSQVSKYLLKKNDLLFTRYNGTIDLLGVCGIVKEDKEFVYPDKLMRVRLNDQAIPEYIEIYFQSDIGRKEALRNAKSSAGQNGISGGDLKSSKVLLPPIKEQSEIVRRLEQLFSLADKIEARYNKAKAQLDKLPQSLLAKAFRGELVPQDENDEPAGAVLGRIKKMEDKPISKKKKLVEVE